MTVNPSMNSPSKITETHALLVERFGAGKASEIIMQNPGANAARPDISAIPHRSTPVAALRHPHLHGGRGGGAERRRDPGRDGAGGEGRRKQGQGAPSTRLS